MDTYEKRVVIGISHGDQTKKVIGMRNLRVVA